MVWCGCQAPFKLELILSSSISRHGIRSAYPPFGESECNTYTKYSAKSFPTFEDWGMTEEEYCRQELTPHGKLVAPRVGEFYREILSYNGSEYSGITDFNFSCDTLAVYADDSVRDVQTAELLVEGFGCGGETEVIVASKDNEYANTVYPVVNDHSNTQQCPTADEEYTFGLIGYDPDFLTHAFRNRIAAVDEFLQMKSYNASICSESNSNYDEEADGPCTLFKTGTQYTGLYFQGMATAPYNRAGYFGELWMLQYVSNVSNWGFGEMSLEELEFMFSLHVQNQIFGANHLNSVAYGSQGLGYILASMEQSITKEPLPGVAQGTNKNILMLVGHDFNLNYAQQILNLQYVFATAKAQHSELYSTTGNLGFDLYQTDDGEQHYVRIQYTVASPMQQRNNEPLTVETPPYIATLVTEFCDNQVFCPYETFKDIVLQEISIDCVEEPLKSTLLRLKASATPSALSPSPTSSSAFTPLTLVTYVISFGTLVWMWFAFLH